MENIPCGIANLGNTCYLNACIQILAELKPLHKILLQMDPLHITKVETKIWNHWREICSLLNKGSSTEGKQILYPRGFVESIQYISLHKNRPLFQNHDPEDITEFLIFFIDSLHECLVRPMDISISGHSENKTDNLAIEVYKRLKSTYEKDFSEISMIFGGVSISSIESLHFPVENYSLTPEIFYYLNLNLPNDSECTLYECLDFYTAPEILQGDNVWYNEKKKIYEGIRKSVFFWKFPDILVICLNRLSFLRVQKNNCLVKYPMLLDLQNYVHGYNKMEFVYELKGVCNHIGTLQGGHYHSFVERNNKWYFCDDEIVQTVDNIEHLVNPHAYCLFYVKKNSSL